MTNLRLCHREQRFSFFVEFVVREDVGLFWEMVNQADDKSAVMSSRVSRISKRNEEQFEESRYEFG